MDCIRPSFDALDIIDTGELSVHLRLTSLTTVSAYSTREKVQLQAVVDQMGDLCYPSSLIKHSYIPTINATARELAGLWTTKSSSQSDSVNTLSYALSSKFNIVIFQVVGAKLTKLAKAFIIMSFLRTDFLVKRQGEKNLNQSKKFEQIRNLAGTQLLEGLESRLKVDKLAKSDKSQLEALFLLVYSALYGLTYELPPTVSPVNAACSVTDDSPIVCVRWYYTERLFCVKESGTATVTAPLPCQNWDLDIPILFQRRAISA
jgi:hypothetical protein